MRASSVILGLSLSLATTHAANAQPFMCGESMVETGMNTTKEEVLEKCGPPTVKTEDRWYYKNQPGGVTVVLVFQIGELEQIEQIPE